MSLPRPLAALLPAVLIGALALAGSSAARADVFGPISLLSASPFQQADYAHDPAISSDGRYVVFDGSVGGVTGVWRREIAPSGAIEEVAGGDARLPSISADGQYISFTSNEGAELPAITDEQPDPEHATGEAPNVYVRNMDKGPEAEGAFEVVSAPNGSTEPLTYEAPSEGGLSAERYGSIAAGRSAISADGRKVAFVTTAVSNLTRYPELEAEEEAKGETPQPHTPPLQVAVRELETETTRLVSVRYDRDTKAPAIDPETGSPEPIPLVNSQGGERGAVFAQGGPPTFVELAKYKVDQQIGASISADGSTVAWMGQNLSEQVDELPAETIKPPAAEPLWRRIAEGEQTPTRRVTGGSQPESPACIASGEQALPVTPSASDPCQGPFNTEHEEPIPGVGGVWVGGSEDDTVPQLSEDGYTVAFLADASLVAVGEFNGKGENSDLYIADMRPGLTRTQALTPLTEIASGDEAAIATNGQITDLGISADGRQVAFTTQRTSFPLGVPDYISEAAAAPGLGELFDVDLANKTLTRVTHGFEGGPSEHPLLASEVGQEDPYFAAHGAEDGALSPSFADGGNLLAFSSTASNLVYGDGNTPTEEVQGDDDGSDVFLVGREIFTPEPAEAVITAPPPNPSPQTPWALSATAASLSSGSVRLYIETPGSGKLHASASGTVVVQTKVKGKHGRKTAKRSTTAARTLASSSVTSKASGLTVVTLKLSRAYAALADRAKGVTGNVLITFLAPGEPTLHERLEVTFKAKVTHKPAARKRGKR